MIMTTKHPFRIRTITVFVTLTHDDFFHVDDSTTPAVGDTPTPDVYNKMKECSNILRKLETDLINSGYEVQTLRISTNPFGEWLTQDECVGNESDHPHKSAKVDTDAAVRWKLHILNGLLDDHRINFFSCGPSTNPLHTIEICPQIIESSDKFSCSAKIDSGDISGARAAAACIQTISTLGNDTDASHLKGGLGNFRFCAASCVDTVPFFPAAKSPTNDARFCFAIGLENGGFARQLLLGAKSISNIKSVFHSEMRKELLPIQEVCLAFVRDAKYSIEYLGIDTSLNPSLDKGGSVADAIESLVEVRGAFGGTGSLAAAAAITTSLQSIPDIKTTGYSGLMLPVLEDRRLAELGMTTNSKDRITIQKLLCISSVCGVGIDTVPIPGDVSTDSLSSLILDMAALAGRWNKPLSCRMFPVPGGNVGEETTFDSPYLCNSRVFDL